MRKEVTVVTTICFIIAIASVVGSASNKSIIETNISDMERYVWYNGNREEHVFAALDEVTIFPKNVSETTNVTEIIRGFDPQATLIRGSEFVTIVRLPNRLNVTVLDRKIAEFQNTKGNSANLVFYKGQKKDQSPIGLTGEIIVHFREDWDEKKIMGWANEKGLETIERFSFSPNTYLFKAGSGIRSLELANQIYLSGDVIYAYPNWWKTVSIRAIPNDTLYPDQWHLNNTGQGGGTAGEDVNITPVWDVYRGSNNEVIAIVDDGLEILHEDLATNILSGYSWDYVGNDSDPTAGNHGTSVAGVAAGRGWNALGITGAAPYTKLVGYRLLSDWAFVEANAYRALSNNSQIVDIYSNSWGPFDDRRLDDPIPLTIEALANGTANGRGGKGNIYVWAGGNGNSANEMLADNSNYDGYANSRYVMAVAASSNYGNQSSYSENGANILVNAPSNGGSLGITTTDRTGALGYNATNYTSAFGGTSSATPLVSGIISLMLQANPNLTWRDVRLIIAKTAKKNDPTDIDWTRNGAGYNINHKYGFGRIDAYAAVNAAVNWTNVGSEIFASAYDSPNLSIPDNNLTGVSDTMNFTQSIGIEFVEINFTAADHTYWGDLEIELISPSGTSSILAKRHNVADGTQRYDNWTFGSVRHLGESSQGTWRLTVKDLSGGDTGTFQKWGLKIYGNQFLPDWNHRKLKTITGTTAGAQTNYTMKLTVYNTSGNDTPGTVYLGGNAKSDFSDLRFTRSDGVTLLDYWIESYISGVNASVWVEVDSIPASPGTADIYLYYGNPSAASASNGKNTFLAYGGLNDFTEYDPNSYIQRDNDTQLSIIDGLASTGYLYKAASESIQDFVLDFDVKSLSPAYGGGNFPYCTGINDRAGLRGYGGYGAPDNDGRGIYTCWHLDSFWRLVYNNLGSYTGSSDMSVYRDTWYYMRVVRSGSTATFYIYTDAARTSLKDSKSLNTGTTAFTYLHAVVPWSSREVALEDASLKNYILRKYANPAPTWSA